LLLDLAAGGSDDMAKDHSVPISYTIELRDTGRYGFILPEDQVLLNIYKHIQLPNKNLSKNIFV